MFITQKMFLLDLLILEKDRESVSKVIVEAGILEPSLHSYFAKDSTEWNISSAAEGKKILSDYLRYVTELKIFFSSYYPDSQAPSAKQKSLNQTLTIPLIGDLLRQHQTKISEFSESRSVLRSRKEDIAVKMAGLRMFNTADEGTRENFKNPENLYLLLGIIHSSNLPLLKHEFLKFKGILLNEGHVDESEIIFIAVPKENTKELNELLDRVYFINHGLPDEFFGKGSLSIMSLGLEFTIACDEELIQEEIIQKEAPKILSDLNDIDRSIELYTKVSDVSSSARQIGQFVLLTGWVSGKEIKVLKAKIEEICGSKYEMHITDSDYFSINTEIPTKLSNPPIFKPFETLVTLFGVPNYQEIDPTPFVAGLYTITYGAMFGDLGQGLVLFLVGLIGMCFKKNPFRLIFSLMVWVGISSSVFGLLYGSVFGYENVLPHLWVSPMQQTNLLLTYSIIFGIGIILLGFILGMLNAVRMRNWSSLIFSHKGIAAFIIYVVLLSMVYLGFTGKPIPMGLPIITVVSTLFLGLERVWEAWFYGHGQYSEAWMGVFDLFEFFLSLLSNTVSFVRVGAFALTHGALMLAIFSLQKLAPNSFVGNLILIGGNLFVIFFEGFIVGIQALRLEYYEFFVRFFQGSGRFFKPVQLDKK